MEEQRLMVQVNKGRISFSEYTRLPFSLFVRALDLHFFIVLPVKNLSEMPKNSFGISSRKIKLLLLHSTLLQVFASLFQSTASKCVYFSA